MARSIDCPYLGASVELTDEREVHMAGEHPELLPHLDLIGGALNDPDAVYPGTRSANSRLFVRWYDDLAGGSRLVVVVVSDLEPRERHWVVTAHISGHAIRGVPEWQRQ